MPGRITKGLAILYRNILENDLIHQFPFHRHRTLQHDAVEKHRSEAVLSAWRTIFARENSMCAKKRRNKNGKVKANSTVVAPRLRDFASRLVFGILDRDRDDGMLVVMEFASTVLV